MKRALALVVCLVTTTTRRTMPQATLPTRRATSTGTASVGRAVLSSAVGMLLWLAAPLLPAGSPPAFGSIEHVFVFMPLVAAPLAMLLLFALLEAESGGTASFHRVAQRVQPVAAALVLASFYFPRGALAGGLTAGWWVLTLLLAVGGLRTLKLRRQARRCHVSLLAALLFLPVGAGWLVLSRLGIRPGNFAALTVFLAALHFHFSGFTLQILIAATGRRVHEAWSRLGALHRCLAIGAIAGILLIAAGNMASSPALKFSGVAAMVLSSLALAITTAAVGLHERSRTPGRLLLVSAACVTAAMLLAGVYGVGELTGAGWIGISKMVAIHGQLNALGFTLCGLIGHLLHYCDGKQRLR